MMGKEFITFTLLNITTNYNRVSQIFELKNYNRGLRIFQTNNKIYTQVVDNKCFMNLFLVHNITLCTNKKVHKHIINHLGIKYHIRKEFSHLRR